MINCQPRNVSYNFSLILIAGSIYSELSDNFLQLSISNLPNSYKLVIKDDDNDEYNTTSNSLTATLAWGKRETDGLLINNISDFTKIFIQVKKSVNLDNIIFHTSSIPIVYNIYKPVIIENINSYFLINNMAFKPYYNIQLPHEFYNYNYDFQSSLLNYQVDNSLFIILYKHIYSLYECEEKLNKKIITCPEILPLPSQQDIDDKYKEIDDKLKKLVDLENIERCKELQYTNKNCNPCFNTIDKCDSNNILIQQTSSKFEKYHGTFPKWWINKNVKTFVDCETNLICEDTCETDYYDKRYFNFRITIIGGGNNDVIITDPVGINSNKFPCSCEFKYNQIVKIFITPTPGYYIVDYIGIDNFIDNIAYVRVVEAVNITIYLKYYTQILSIDIIGEGNVLSISEGGINCGNKCSNKFKRSSEIELYAIPKFKHSFYKWSNIDVDNGDKCIVKLDTDKNITAEFVISKFNLETIVKGIGIIRNSINGICNNICVNKYEYDTIVSLTAENDSTSSFIEWGGDINIYEKVNIEITLEMNKNRSVTAYFITNPILNITFNPINIICGEVIGEDLHCESTCQKQYKYNDFAYLNVTSYEGYIFNKWTGDYESNSSNIELQMDCDKNLIANFIKETSYYLNITVTGIGSVNINSTYINTTCDTFKSLEFNKNREVKLSVLSGDFLKWNGDVVSIAESIDIKMTKIMNITAQFDILSICGIEIMEDVFDNLYVNQYSIKSVQNIFSITFNPHTSPDRFLIIDADVKKSDYSFDDYLNNICPNVIFDSGWLSDLPFLYDESIVSLPLSFYNMNRSDFNSTHVTVVVLSWKDSTPGWELKVVNCS